MKLIDLHIVIALKEVGDFPLAEFRLAQLSRGCGTAKHEVSTLLRAVRSTLVREDQLFETKVSSSL